MCLVPCVENYAHYQSQGDQHVQQVIFELDPPGRPTAAGNVDQDEKSGPRRKENPQVVIFGTGNEHSHGYD